MTCTYVVIALQFYKVVAFMDHYIFWFVVEMTTRNVYSMYILKPAINPDFSYK